MKECPICHDCQDDDLERCPEDGGLLEWTMDGGRLLDGKYRLVRRLGSGGMGTVYLAIHEGLGKEVAVKLLRPKGRKKSYATRFAIEARALGKLDHPNILRVTDYGIDPRCDGMPFLVMEYLQGKLLYGWIRERGALPSAEALSILGQVADAMESAHACKLLHRDLKPSNVFLLERPGTPWEVRILDFGLARFLDGEEQDVRQDSWEGRRGGDGTNSCDDEKTRILEAPDPAHPAHGSPGRLTRADVVLGTPGYIAPELLEGGESTVASDVYSFGVLAYELFTGRLPFQGPEGHITDQQRFEIYPRPSSVNPLLPKVLDVPILAAMHRDPAGRTPTVRRAFDEIRDTLKREEWMGWRRRMAPRYMAISGLLALLGMLVYAGMKSTRLLADLDSRCNDRILGMAPAVPPDPRILLLSIDDDSLEADGTLLAERSREFGQRLRGVLAAGASCVALDFQLPVSWSDSPDFSRLVMENPDRLVLALFIKKDGSSIGWESVQGLTTAGLRGRGVAVENLFGFVNMQEDPDGKIRTVPAPVRAKDGGWLYPMSHRAAAVLGGRDVAVFRSGGLLDLRTDWMALPRISWKDLESQLRRDPSIFRGKLVFVGGEYAASGDEHRIPGVAGRSGTVPGLVIQALMTATVLASFPVRTAGEIWVILIPGLLVLAAALPSLFARRGATALVFVLGVPLFLEACYLVFFQFNPVLVPAVSFLVAYALGVLPVWVVRKLEKRPEQSGTFDGETPDQNRRK